MTTYRPYVLPTAILLLLLAFTLVLAKGQDISITPEQIKNLPDFPREYIEELKKHENFDLAQGKRQFVTLDKDKYGNTDIGYGFTKAEIEDAMREGFLPLGSTLPSRMTKAQADHRFEHVTLPTYRSIVRKMVKVVLTLDQEFSLTAFVQNTGRTNLQKLITGPERLNGGNYESVLAIMPKYYADLDLKPRAAFQIAIFKGESPKPKT